MAYILFKWLITSVVVAMHPFFVSVTEINHNTKEKTIEISVRIFVDDFEKTLGTYGKAKIDLLNGTENNTTNKIIHEYVQKNLLITVNDQPLNYVYLGYEIQSESAWMYFEVKNINAVKKLTVQNKLLHDFDKKQLNIVHAKANGKKESSKLDYSNSMASFFF